MEINTVRPATRRNSRLKKRAKSSAASIPPKTISGWPRRPSDTLWVPLLPCTAGIGPVPDVHLGQKLLHRGLRGRQKGPGVDPDPDDEDDHRDQAGGLPRRRNGTAVAG